MEETPEPKDATVHTPTVAQHEDTVDDYAHGKRLVALTVSLMLGMFLVALDNVCFYNPQGPQQGDNNFIGRQSSVRQFPELPTSSTTSTRYRGMAPPIS